MDCCCCDTGRYVIPTSTESKLSGSCSHGQMWDGQTNHYRYVYVPVHLSHAIYPPLCEAMAGCNDSKIYQITNSLQSMHEFYSPVTGLIRFPWCWRKDEQTHSWIRPTDCPTLWLSECSLSSYASSRAKYFRFATLFSRLKTSFKIQTFKFANAWSTAERCASHKLSSFQLIVCLFKHLQISVLILEGYIFMIYSTIGSLTKETQPSCPNCF